MMHILEPFRGPKARGLALTALTLLSTATALRPTVAWSAPEIFVDAVAASVDGKPITLKEICAKLRPPRKLTMSEASTDPEARQILESMIVERVIKAEAETRRLNVGEDEVEQYVSEVAKRNGLNPAELELALTREGRNIEEYRREVQIEILKTKLAADFVRGGVSVSEDEVQNYIDEHPELSRSSGQVRLRQIVVSGEKHGADRAKEVMEQVETLIGDGKDFSEVAKRFSDSPEARDGGLLGIMAESEFSPDVFEAIARLEPGQTSAVVAMGNDLRMFKLEERIGGEEQEREKLVQEVREILSNQKAQGRMSSYFTTELYKQHSVDKKI